MAKLVVSTFIGNGSLRLYLDNNQVMSDSDAVSVDLNDGEEYIVHWFVKGEYGSSYSITISSPREAQFQLTRVIDRSGKAAGGFRFQA